MNLDELQSVQARERQSSDLQHMRPTFYKEVGEFIKGLTEERTRAVEAADDPFSEPKVRRLTDDIETAESTVEAIYERRVGKVVKKASITAAGMPIDDEGLTSEEEALFEDLVTRIETNRETVLSVLDGESSTVSRAIDEDSSAGRTDRSTESGGRTDDEPPRASDDTPPGEDSPPADEAVSTADLMGDNPDMATEDPIEGESKSTQDSNSPPKAADEPSAVSTDRESGDGGRDRPQTDEASVENDDRTDLDASAEDDSESERDRIPGLPRTTVRITADVGEIVGADDRDYNLETEDVITLPEPNAEMLIEKNAAERLQ